MRSAKQQTAISSVQALLREWDKGSKVVRKQILQDFIVQNQNKTTPELEAEFANAASLFLVRLTAWLRLTYMNGTCLSEQLKALQIFLSASGGNKFLLEFLEVGGMLTALELLGLKQAEESSKFEALKLLFCVANAGHKYKELICESFGIRAIAECMAKAHEERTQEAARVLLQSLAEGNSKYEVQVYKGLIALLPCSSPKAQQMALQTLRIVQPIVKTAHPNIVEPLLNLLKSLHLEVQYEAVEFIKDLIDYDIRDDLMKSLVRLLRPSKDEVAERPAILDDPDVAKITPPLPVFIQQASAAKCIGILSRKSNILAEMFVQLQVVSKLMFAMGNVYNADSQRQAAITLEIFCSKFSQLDDVVHKAMGDALYDLFMADPDLLYTRITPVQLDILTSNQIAL